MASGAPPDVMSTPAVRRREARLAADGLERRQQLVDHARHAVRARVDPSGFAHQLVPLDARAEELPGPHLARDRLIRHDADAEARS